MDGMAKKTMIRLDGREFPIVFTLRTLIRLKEENPDFDVSNISKALATPGDLVKVLYFMMADAAKLEEKELDVDEDWIALRISISPRRFVGLQLKIIHAITDNMSMESGDEDEDREVDLVLQEIQKKSEKTASPGEKSQPGD
jgi:hypothetical protein